MAACVLMGISLTCHIKVKPTHKTKLKHLTYNNFSRITNPNSHGTHNTILHTIVSVTESQN